MVLSTALQDLDAVQCKELFEAYILSAFRGTGAQLQVLNRVIGHIVQAWNFILVGARPLFLSEENSIRGTQVQALREIPGPIVDVCVAVYAWALINHFASVDVYTRKTFPNCKTEDVYTRFAALF